MRHIIEKEIHNLRKKGLWVFGSKMELKRSIVGMELEYSYAKENMNIQEKKRIELEGYEFKEKRYDGSKNIPMSRIVRELSMGKVVNSMKEKTYAQVFVKKIEMKKRGNKMYVIFKEDVDAGKFYVEQGHFLILSGKQDLYEVEDEFTPMIQEVAKEELDGKFIVIEKEEYEKYKEILEDGWNKEISEYVEDILKKYNS